MAVKVRPRTKEEQTKLIHEKANAMIEIINQFKENMTFAKLHSTDRTEIYYSLSTLDIAKLRMDLNEKIWELGRLGMSTYEEDKGDTEE